MRKELSYIKDEIKFTFKLAIDKFNEGIKKEDKEINEKIKDKFKYLEFDIFHRFEDINDSEVRENYKALTDGYVTIINLIFLDDIDINIEKNEFKLKIISGNDYSEIICDIEHIYHKYVPIFTDFLKNFNNFLNKKYYEEKFNKKYGNRVLRSEVYHIKRERENKILKEMWEL